ncbi:MAG: PilN domain-containing protein [Armatimonadetes bacterium]|nr:PilN domain-containing protein [Armatimonadota bacterium]
MPLVNLIKEDRLVAAQRERHVRLLLIACVVIGGGSFLASGLLAFETQKLHTASKQLIAIQEKLEPYLSQVDANEGSISSMQPKIQILSDAVDQTEQWTRILDHLRSNMPNGVWLTSVTCTRMVQTKPITVTLKGYSTTQESVGFLILRLNLSKDLEGTQLKFTQERRTEDGKALEFEVTSELVGSAPPAPTVKEA